MDTQTIRELRYARNNKVLDLRQLAQALGGKVVGGQVLCPGPGHSAGNRRSLLGRLHNPHLDLSLPATPATIGELIATTCSKNSGRHEKAAWLWSRRRPISQRAARRLARRVPQPPITQIPNRKTRAGVSYRDTSSRFTRSPLMDGSYLSDLRPSGNTEPGCVHHDRRWWLVEARRFGS
jgi:hypothetical protein